MALPGTADMDAQIRLHCRIATLEAELSQARASSIASQETLSCMLRSWQAPACPRSASSTSTADTSADNEALKLQLALEQEKCKGLEASLARQSQPQQQAQASAPPQAAVQEQPAIALTDSAPKPSCAVYFANLPRNITAKDLLAHIRGGPVRALSIFPMNTITVDITQTGVCLFVNGEDAAAYVEYRKKNALVLDRTEVVIRHLETSFPSSSINKIHTTGSTRCLLVQGVAPSMAIESIVFQLRNDASGWSGNSTGVASFSRDASGLHLEFASIDAAVAAALKFTCFRVFYGAQVSFQPDTCAQPLDTLPPQPVLVPVSKPQDLKPAAAKPPAAKPPAARPPAARPPAARPPAAKPPATKTPAAKAPAAKAPAEKTPPVKTLPAKTLHAKTPRAKIPTSKPPSAKIPASEPPAPPAAKGVPTAPAAHTAHTKHKQYVDHDKTRPGQFPARLNYGDETSAQRRKTRRGGEGKRAESAMTKASLEAELAQMVVDAAARSPSRDNAVADIVVAAEEEDLMDFSEPVTSDSASPPQAAPKTPPPEPVTRQQSAVSEKAALDRPAAGSVASARQSPHAKLQAIPAVRGRQVKSYADLDTEEPQPDSSGIAASRKRAKRTMSDDGVLAQHVPASGNSDNGIENGDVAEQREATSVCDSGGGDGFGERKASCGKSKDYGPDDLSEYY